MELIERYRGCLLGLAVGDAVGTTLEFKSPGAFAPIDDMVGGEPFGLERLAHRDLIVSLAERLFALSRAKQG